MPLFEVAILYKPTKSEEDEGHEDKLLFGPEALVAENRDAAIAKASASSGLDKSTRITVLVRPFV